MAFLERPGPCRLVLVLLSLLYFAPLGLHPTQIVYAEHSDIVSTHYPWRVFAVRSWQATHSLPLWFPYGCGGQPFLADSQATLLYPPHLVFYLVPETWVGPLFGLLIWAHVLVAGLAMFTYAQAQGLDPFPALVAAVGFMFAGKWLVHLLEAGHDVFVPLAWFPLLLLCAEQGIQRRRPSSAVGAGVLAAVMFSGLAPQLMLYAGLLAFLLTLRPAPRPAGPLGASAAGCGRMRAALTSVSWWLGTWLIAAVVAGGLAAVQLLPSLELAARTTRAQVGSSESGRFYEWTLDSPLEFGQRLLSLVGPQNFGGNAWEGVGAFGVLWTAVALLAIGLCRRPLARLHGALLLVLVVLALGGSTPLYPFLQEVVPGLALFRIPARFLLFAGLPLGMLAGCATQELFAAAAASGQVPRRAAAFTLVVVGVFLAASLTTGPPSQAYWSCVVVLGPALAGVLYWRSLPSGRPGSCAAVWLALLVADLWALHGPLVRTRPVGEVFPATDAVRFLAEHPGRYRVLDRPLPSRPPPFSPLTPALCYLHGIEALRGHNPTDLYSYKQYLNFIAGSDVAPTPAQVPEISSVQHQQLLDLLNVRYLLSPSSQPLTPGEEEHWQQMRTLTDNQVYVETDITQGGLDALAPYVVYERKEPLPRAFVVREARLAPTRAGLLPALQETDLRRTVLLESPRSWFEPLAEPVPGSLDGPAFQRAEVVVQEPNRVVVEVDGQEPGYLVLLDIWYPGWKCRTAGGQELPVWRANALFRAVLLPPGRHRLDFEFAPRSYRRGKHISLMTAGLLLAFAAWRMWRLIKAIRKPILFGTPVARNDRS